MRADIKPGARFPDYQLPDHTGRLRTLSEIQGEDPMIIVLAREAYSAKDQVQHQGLVELWREMKPGVGYCRLVTVTTTNSQEALNYRWTWRCASACGKGTEADPSRGLGYPVNVTHRIAEAAAQDRAVPAWSGRSLAS